MRASRLPAETMDDNEMEMTKEELQIFIRESVSRSVRKKCNHLQFLLRKKEKMSTDLANLLESVSKYEATVRRIYSELGWEYKETDTEGNGCYDTVSISGRMCDETESLQSASPVSDDMRAYESDSKLIENKKITEINSKIFLVRELRVVLHKLPTDQIPRRNPPTGPSKRAIGDDELSNYESDYTPSECTSDPDFAVEKRKRDRRKRRRLRKSERVAVKRSAKVKPASHPASFVEPSTSVPPANTNRTSGASAPEVVPDEKTKSKPLIVSDSSDTERRNSITPPPPQTKKLPPVFLPTVLKDLDVGVQVLARRQNMRWESGKIAGLFQKEDGTKKYKVTFEHKGKVMVSGHHIAYNEVPKLVHLNAGARVLSKSNPKNDFFTPGILGELPSRKNHMRFLIFFDDETACYVALPAVRLVFKQLPDPLGDIRNKEHQDFLREYFQKIPYPPHTQFRLGQKLKVRRNGDFELCKVLLLDCSMMKVQYVKDERIEWVYRGSVRLELVSFKEEFTA